MDLFQSECEDQSQDFGGESLILAGLTDTSDLVQLTYPRKFIKRFMYRPFLCSYYPYVDIHSPNEGMQLSFWYDQVVMNLSEERFCLGCKKETNINSGREFSFPVALCESCHRNLFKDYWLCLHTILQSTCIERDMTLNNGENRIVPCADLLAPSCGLEITFSKSTPCLQHHDIGLLFHSQEDFDLIVAPKSRLIPQIIGEGGIFAVILTDSEQIVNLSRLSQVLTEMIGSIFTSLRNISKTWEKPNLKVENNSIKFRATQWEPNQENDILLSHIAYQYSQMGPERPNLFGVQIYDDTFKLLKCIIKEILRTIPHLRADFIDLSRIYPRFHPKTMQYMEKYIEIHGSEYDKRLVQKEGRINSDLVPLFEFESCWSEFDLYRILGVWGKYGFVESSLSDIPHFISFHELIGREII